MSTQKSNNFLRFLRQNLVLIIIIACVLAITGIILGVSLGKSPVTPVGPSVNDTYLGEFNDYLVPPSIIQKATAECLDVTSDLSVYETNMNLLYDKLTEIGRAHV